jgi:hypothetical protein
VAEKAHTSARPLARWAMEEAGSIDVIENPPLGPSAPN